MKLKLERIEEALLCDALQKEIENEENTLRRCERGDSYIRINEIQTLKHLVKTIEKTFGIEKIRSERLLEAIEELKQYVDDDMMKEYEEEDKDWFKEFEE